MATYQANITKNLEPATASVNPLIRAAEASAQASRQVAEGNASMAKTLSGVGETLFKGYQDYQVAAAEQEATNLAGELFISGQAATVAGQQAAQVEAQKARFQMLSTGPQMPDAQAALDNQLRSFDNEITRLKNASMGGMSNEEYVSRIDTLTKKAIAKTPGMADKIRERVGSITGLAGADRWATQSYVKDRFSTKEKAKTPTLEDMAIKDIDAVAPMGTYGTRQELFKLYQTNLAEYNNRMDGAKQTLALQTQTKVIKDNVTGLNGQSDLQADTQRASFMAVFSGTLGSSVLTQTVQDKEQVFGTTLDLMAKGNNVSVDIVPFKVQIDMHAAQMRTSIEASKRQAYVTIDSYLANNPNVTDAKRKELYADVDRAATMMQNKYADDKGVGLVAMANIMKSYRDKSIGEKTQLVDLAIKQQSVMQNNPMVMAYWAGGEARENLKRTNRSFFEFMVGQEQELTSNIMGIRNELKGSNDLAGVERVITAAQKGNGAAVPIDPVASPTVTKAAHQALGASAVEVLKKSSLSRLDINTVSAALSTATEYGANSVLLANNYKTLGVSIAKLPDQDQGVIKANVSNSIRTSVISVNSVKSVIESKYGVKLELGTNDLGEISVVMPQPAPVQITAGRPAQPTPIDNSQMLLASNEFMKQVKPMLNNMVYGRTMLTQEDVKNVGADFAKILNSGESYTGFFNLGAKPVTPAAVAATSTAVPASTTPDAARLNVPAANVGASVSGKVTPATPAPAATTPATATPVSLTPSTNVDLDTQVRGALDKMKTIDPTMNLEYVYNAYKQSTPKKQKELAILFKNNTVRMADLSGNN
jgi:hypothetical protein